MGWTCSDHEDIPHDPTEKRVTYESQFMSEKLDGKKNRHLASEATVVIAETIGSLVTNNATCKALPLLLVVLNVTSLLSSLYYAYKLSFATRTGKLYFCAIRHLSLKKGDEQPQ